MGLRIIYGRAGSGKSEFCFKEIAKKIKSKEKIYIITPEQFSFTAEKKLMQAIDTNAVINAEVITLTRMAHRILGEIGEDNKSNLSKCGKSMLIYSILNENKKQLKFLGKSDENIDLSITAITELKKHGISVESLKEEISKNDDKYLNAKLNDITTIYEAFEKKIQDNYIDDTDLLTILSKNIDKTDYIKNSIIYIDEFAGFTHQEYEVIKELIRHAKEVTITICTDNLCTNTNPDIDIFSSNKITVRKILDMVKKEKLDLKESIFLEQTYRFKTSELKHLELNLYNNKPTKYEQKVENIQLFLAKNPYSEIENIAKQITKLVRENNFRYRDISVITKDLETYSSLARVIFSEYGIPVFIDEKRDLNQNILVQYLLSILEVLSKNYAQEAVFYYLKTGFINLEEDEIFKLENYCTKWGIKNNKWKKDFTYEEEKENKKKEIERLNEIRKQIVEPLVSLREKIWEEKTAQNITKEIYNFLIEQGIEDKLEQKINQLEEKGLIDLANEYKTSFQVILDVLDEIVVIFKEEKMNLEKYTQILKIGLKNSGLGKIPGTQDQVTLGDVERSRSHKVDIIFIVGLNDGSFPTVNKDEGFLNDLDRQKLKEDGIELAKGTIEKLYEDNFNIYKAFSTAEKKLYLSYSSSDKEGKSLRPSILINKIKKMYPELKEQSDVISKKYEITTQIATYEELIEKIAKLQDGEKIEDIWYNIYYYYKTNNEWKEKLRKDLEGLQYTNRPCDIDKNNIQKLYGNVLSTSISKLEKYRNCPFSYYLQYGLKLKEKEQLKIQNFQTGTFMHEIIDEFFERIHDEKSNLAELEKEDIEKIVSELVEEKLNISQNFIFTATAKYKLLVKRLKRIISKALQYIIQGLIYSDFSIIGTEVEFSKNGEYKPIILQLEDGMKVEITGKIDRIDTASSEDGKYLRIIDYKSSAKNIDLNEVYAGIQIQLLTYLDAVCKKEDAMAAGILYFGLLEQMVKADKKISEEEIEEQIRKNFKMKGLILADVKVIQMQDRNLKSGISKLIPAGITTSGSINEKCTNGVKKEEFKILQDYIDKTIKQIAKEILSGKIEIKPSYKKGKKPCEYCNYQSICGFNTKNDGNSYYYINNYSNDEVIKKMKHELDKS